MAYIGQKPGSNFRDVVTKDSFTGDGSTVAFDLSKSFSQAGQNDLQVFVDNVRQEPTTAYTVGQDGNGDFKRITFTAAPAASASIYVLNQGETSGVIAVSDGAVTSGKLNVDSITGQTELAEAANNTDTVLLHDTSASALKKIQVSNLTAQAGDGLAKSSATLSVDIPNTTLLNDGAASNDEILIFDTSTSTLKSITQTNLLNFPTVTSVSPTNVVSGDGTGNHTFVITGTGFTGATATLLNDSGSAVAFASQTVDSNTQITGVIAKSSLLNSGEPFDVKVTAGSGLTSTLANQINLDAQPVFSTAAGSLFSGESADFTTQTLFASDPESAGDVTYAIESGSLPAGLSGTSESSGFRIAGTPTVPGSNTTSTFTIRAKDAASNTSDRQFTITINAPVTQTFTSSGTFSVPSGVSSVDVLVVAGGGGGGYEGGGGGAGGLIFRPGFSVTPGGTVSVTVGGGGAGSAGPAGQSDFGDNGQDSVFGTLTAKGGGFGGTKNHPQSTTGRHGNSGGSGGGAARDMTSPGGGAGQPTPPGESGTFGSGNAGGSATGSSTRSAGGGGGAGAAGQDSGAPDSGSYPGSVSKGGVGKAYTIGDGTTSVFYAGGGGGGSFYSTEVPGGQGGGGSGGTPGYSNPDAVTIYGGENGTANRGGGGGGAGNSGSNSTAGTGGKGIVIVRWT